MKKLNLLTFILIALFTVVSCTTGEKNTTEDFTVAKSNLQRESSPSVTPSQETAVVDGNTQFALDLYAELTAGNTGNIFYSPWSISIALAMTWAGAAGNTAAQMADTMYFGQPDDVHPVFNSIDLDLMALGTGNADEFRLEIANAIWGQSGYPFQQAFLDTIAVNYGSGLNLLDFMTDPEAGRTTINDWVADQTEDRILDLLPEGSITTNTKLVLTNAIYFKADWLTQFEPDMTGTTTFTLDDQSTVSCEMMNGEFNYPGVETPDYKAVELPYKGEQASMVVILPAEGTFSTFEASMDASLLSTIEDSLLETDMMLSLPKFSFEFNAGLNNILKNLGMTDAFIPGVADFSNLDGTQNLYISDVVHKAFVAVDEEGTEAAAATGVIIGDTSVPSFSFIANRPFIFYIRDRISGTILFIGRVKSPV
ncbi:serpin family protein [Myxococcota bacterium]|nr:serpin family protein [Myxococcota bacterium]MBU1381698.1 serpin family protein [Myxococcota bacterium]MBU1498972.1 serpin family protein [Myxococcota bacterium]